MDNPRAAQEAAVVIDMMTTVQRGAKRLRARHIYSGAQGVLSALHHETHATLESRIKTLGFVVTEYARGLDELLETPGTAPAKTPIDRWNAVRDTLNALLPVATPDDADMLSRLMRAPVTLDTVRPDLKDSTPNADVLPFVKADYKDAEPYEDTPNRETFQSPKANTLAPPRPQPETSSTTDGLFTTLDAMMRDVIADALSIARTVGRTISLSYDMGDRKISAQKAENLRSRLGQALSQIIRQSFTEGRVGHIDINLAGEALHIIAGTTAVRIAIEPKNNSSQTQPKPEPLITPETEGELRAQLHALMDPISHHETAS